MALGLKLDSTRLYRYLPYFITFFRNWLAICLLYILAKGPRARGAVIHRAEGSYNGGDFSPKPTPSLIHHRRPTLYYPPLQNGWAAVMAGPSPFAHQQGVSARSNDCSSHFPSILSNFPIRGLFCPSCQWPKQKASRRRPFICPGAGGRIRTDTELTSAGF